MITSYLKELIDHNNRIIIPDFGAFMIQDTPEGKQITFNDFLKFNDGLLVNQIIKAEKTSKNQASEQIKEFIKEVENCFAANKPYELTGLGFLTKDSHGNIKFEKTSAFQSVPHKTTDVKPTIVLDEAPAEPKIKEVEKPIEKVPEPQPFPEKPKVSEIPKTEPVTASPGTVTEKTTPVKTHQTTDYKTNTSKNFNSHTMKNNTLRNVLIIAIIVVFIGGVTWIAYQFDLIGKITDRFFKKQVTEEPILTVVTDSIAITDTLIVTDSLSGEPVIVEETETKIDPETKRYYIVAGSFKIASNANRFNKKLTNEGYMSEIVMRSNGFHCVTYKTVYEKQEAIQEWQKLREKNPQTWILIK